MNDEITFQTFAQYASESSSVFNLRSRRTASDRKSEEGRDTKRREEAKRSRDEEKERMFRRGDNGGKKHQRGYSNISQKSRNLRPWLRNKGREEKRRKT